MEQKDWQTLKSVGMIAVGMVVVIGLLYIADKLQWINWFN